MDFKKFCIVFLLILKRFIEYLSGKHLWPFLQGSEVPNFPFHDKYTASTRAAHVAKSLRIIEMQENKYTKELKLIISSNMDNSMGIATAPGSPHSMASDVVPDGDLTGRIKEGVAMANEQNTELATQLTSIESGEQKTEEAIPSRRSSIITARDSTGGKSGSDLENTSNKGATDVSSSLHTPEEDQEESDSMTAELLEKGPIENVLYDAFDLTTPKRKRTQVRRNLKFS